MDGVVTGSCVSFGFVTLLRLFVLVFWLLGAACLSVRSTSLGCLWGVSSGLLWLDLVSLSLVISTWLLTLLTLALCFVVSRGRLTLLLLVVSCRSCSF